jgi:ATP-dependent helicase Lhr and Lhr-like helicase
MPLSRFHPVTAQWFTDTVGTPTAAQTGGWAAIRDGRPTLIAAPTGSGKTLAAFLSALDDLLQEGLRAPLPDEVRIVYVSPLKALSADIHKNLSEPRRGLARVAEAAGVVPPRITAAVRTGDTPQSERAAMLRTPPHILVTTPESLYLLLTAERSRDMLRTVRTVIVDEIHAVIGTRRGAHLALSLERLQQVAAQPPLRIGLSATQKPIAEVARFLVGTAEVDAAGCARCAIVDEGHRRAMDLALETPRSALEAVMSNDVWEEYYDRLAALVAAHKTTLVFVNTRRMAERLARHLSERLGGDAVTAHHGSLSKEKRLDAEARLKGGQLKALVATASLELGIDIGHVDLACQIGSPHRIATFLQRVGRSGHTIGGVPKGRLFPVSRDDLIECVALMRSVRKGELDAVVRHDAPLDVLSQQIVAEAACRDYGEDELFDLVRRALPFRDLSRHDFDAVVATAADGFATRRGRRGALIHRDEVHARVRGRRGSRLLAITSGGAIPEVADYRVILDPDDTFIGTLNEDFAIESMAGDVFQLGNTSWRVLQVGPGTVRVADAHGAPPNIPFWLGEAPARSDELSRAVSGLRVDIEARLLATTIDTTTINTEPAALAEQSSPTPDSSSPPEPSSTPDVGARVMDGSACSAVSVVAWLTEEAGVSAVAAEQAVRYLAEARRALGVLPTQETLVLERFFDESGGMQLVLHAPFGSRVNKAWGLALRKRFCRQFDFELQAAATDEALLLSLGPQHSFPLTDVFRYLSPVSVRDVLIQAFLDAPVFQTRWRWNSTISLAVPRNRGGRKVPPQLQRMMAADLMAAAFPDAAACLDNIPGDRQIPDHPLVGQTIRDCLEEAMDIDGLTAVLERIQRGQLRLVARDTAEPSVLAHEIVNARPYAFLDDAPLEERRTQAVLSRRASDPASAADLGRLDADAIARVRAEARPDPRDEDELHDALLTGGFLTADDLAPGSCGQFERLQEAGRAALVNTIITAELAETGETDKLPEAQTIGRSAAAAGGVGRAMWVAAERLPEMIAVHPDARIDGHAVPPPSRAGRAWTREEAVLELLRGRLDMTGPTTARALAAAAGVDVRDADAALLGLESEGVVLRGAFTAGSSQLEWCDRRLLARIHRYTLARLRAEIEPASPADFMRFLFAWQHVEPSSRLAGLDGLRAVVSALDGFELAAAAWERVVLPARLDRYEPALLDTLCLTGEVGWARLSPPDAESGGSPSRLNRATAIALFLREHADAWRALHETPDLEDRDRARSVEDGLSAPARALLSALRTRGASFLRELDDGAGHDGDIVQAVGELVAAGLVTSDGFAGLRSMLAPPAARPSARRAGAHAAGRWSLLHAPSDDGHAGQREETVAIQAWALLRRYGVVFRRLLAREANAAPWRELARAYRRLEARGEIRGGRFVSGMSGEQFALADAVDRLREIRRTPGNGAILVIGAADPLNLAGIVTAGDRVRAAAGSRVAYADGIPVAALDGECVRPLADVGPSVSASLATALTGRRMPPVAAGYVGRAGALIGSR